MESSRIFVKGLPPNLSPDDFRKHFSKQHVITDAKFIPHRRIGYVGYKTPEDAAKAVKFHNKSFIRMSKISVELARSVDYQYALGSGTNSANSSKRKRADVQEHSPTDTDIGEKRRRTREGLADFEGKPKLQEVLDMRPPSKSNMWENQDAETLPDSARPIPKAENAVTHAVRNQEAHEHAAKKGKTERQSEKKDVVSSEPPAPVNMPNVDAKTVPSDRDLSQEVTQERLTKSLAISDADWLRSRTSRLLGLMDDGDVQTTALPQDAPIEQIGLSEVSEPFKEGSVSNASVQTDEELEVEGTKLENATAGNGRLFVRNLTYTITEEDLRKYFEDQCHGTIEEVSPKLYDC